MEALEELAVSYERQDVEMEANNQEKEVLQCEVEKLQVSILSLCSYYAFLYWISHSIFHTPFHSCVHTMHFYTGYHIPYSILHSIVWGTGENTAVFSHPGSRWNASANSHRSGTNTGRENIWHQWSVWGEQSQQTTSSKTLW